MAIISKLLMPKQGNLSLPDKTIPFWGFASFWGEPQMPSVTIEAEVGDTIRIYFYNSFFNISPIGEPVSITFPGQENVKVLQGFYGGSFEPVQPQYSVNGNLISLTNFNEHSSFYNPLILIYEFIVNKPGVYLYESGTNSEKQIQMGLYGTIIVHPKGYNDANDPNYKTAYGTNTNSDYDLEKTFVLSEIDSKMHEEIIPDEYYDTLTFNPDNWVINGRCFPDTIDDTSFLSQPYNSKISCYEGQKILLRVLNAGFSSHTIYFGGLMGTVIGKDSYPLTTSNGDATYKKTGMTLGAGQSTDIILTPENAGENYIYSREYNHLVNNDQFPGGMMTKIEVLNI